MGCRLKTTEKRRLAFGFREMLEESVSDLRSTMCELQERLHSVDGEGELMNAFKFNSWYIDTFTVHALSDYALSPSDV